MPKTGWWIVAAIALIELGVIVANPQASKATLRTIYVWLWEHAPKPEGTPIPDRFL